MIILRKIASLQSDLGAVIADTISGTQNGSNKVFYTTYEYRPDHITFYYNGQALHPDYDFLQTGTNQITLKYIAPDAVDNLRASYELSTSNYGPAYKGRESILLGSTSKSIVFSSPLSNTNYNISIDLSSSDAIPSVYSWVISQKTTGGFTVFFSGEIDTANYILEWEVFT